MVTFKTDYGNMHCIRLPSNVSWKPHLIQNVAVEFQPQEFQPPLRTYQTSTALATLVAYLIAGLIKSAGLHP